MDHIALYRLWRPQTFQDVIGQQHIVRTLKNSLKEGRISHAYLFSGPRGTGKTSAAKILAKAVNCENRSSEEPCNECSSCERITEGSVMDVLEIDAASNRGVEEIRDIRDKVKYAPTEVIRKVYIIDEVHMLTTEAFNALLKTLEEPPAHVMFILATTEPHRLPATIISRCQRFDFRRVGLDDQVGRLQYICEQEQLEVEPDALQYIARLSDGGMRDAVSLLDQISSFANGTVTYADVVAVTGGIGTEQFKALAEAMKEQDIGRALELIEALMHEGKSADKCMESLIQYFRDLLMVKLVPNALQSTERILDPSQFTELSESFGNAQLFAMIDILNHYLTEMKYASQPQTLLEIAIMKICSTSAIEASQDHAEVIKQLSDKVERMERQLAQLQQQGVSTQPQTAVTPPVTASSAVQSSKEAPAVRGTAHAAQSSIADALGRAPSAAVVSPFKSGAKVQAFVQGTEGQAFRELLSKWNEILNQVRDRKVTVHAWLMNGEPVAILDEQVLIAFKNDIHRETTEKPANKQLIEQVMNEVLGKSITLVTVMQKEWQELSAGDEKPSQQEPAEELQLEPEDLPEGKHKEEWINEAIDLFGEDLVVIKED